MRSIIDLSGRIFGRLTEHRTPEEAALTYDFVVRDIDGDYARLNFPKKGELSCR